MYRLKAEAALEDLRAGRTHVPPEESAAVDHVYGLVMDATGDEEQAKDVIGHLAWAFERRKKLDENLTPGA